MSDSMSRLSTEELEKAFFTLQEALAFADQTKQDPVRFKIARDACVQRFEYSIELSWKVAMKKLGSQTKFAKPAIREMARADLIESAETWLGFIEAHNDSSHSYDEDVARKVFAEIQKYAAEAPELISRLKKMP